MNKITGEAIVSCYVAAAALLQMLLLLMPPLPLPLRPSLLISFVPTRTLPFRNLIKTIFERAGQPALSY